MKKLSLIIACLIISLIGGFLSFVYLSNPLVMAGFKTIHTKPNNTFDITYNIYNKGSRNIEIQEVYINGKASHETIDLGISFDTSQIVQAGTTNPNTLFFPLQEQPVKPKLTNEEIEDALKKKEKTPIDYAILVKDFTGTIETMIIKYNYFGFTVTKQFEFNDEYDVNES